MEKYVVLPNSPVEFAISGPSGGRDRILVRSENAGLDLIGLAAQSGPDSHRGLASDPLALLFGQSRQLNIVSSFPLADLNPEADSRMSKFSFAWRGYTSGFGVKRVEETLNSILPELHRAIRLGDVQEIEWTLSQLIFRCTEVSERRLRSRRFMLATFAIYVAIGFLMLLYWIYKSRF